MTYHKDLNKTVELNMPMVQKIAGKFKTRDSNKFLFSYKDLVQEGVLGLIRAHKGYNKSKAKFSTYAYIKIRGSIIDHLRSLKRNKDISIIHLGAMTEKEVEPIEDSTLETSSELFENLCKGLNSREKYIAEQVFIYKQQYKYIANSLGVSVSLVTSIVNDCIYPNFVARQSLMVKR